jgi:hypothetical protein
MARKEKETLTQRKALLEQKLTARVSVLTERGIVGPKTDKDTIAGRLRGDIRALNRRLRWIAANDKKTEEMAKAKAEKAARPREEKQAAKAAKSRKAPAEGKEKQAKPDKAEGGKGGKTEKAEKAGKAAGKTKAKE